MATHSAENLRRDIQDILKGADLNSLTSKKVRRQLEEKHGIDLTSRKKEIDTMLMDELDKQAETAPNGTTETDDKQAETAANGTTETDAKEDGSEPKSEDENSESDFEPPEDADELQIKPKAKVAKKKVERTQTVDDEEYARELQETDSRPTRHGRARKAPKHVKRKRREERDKDCETPKKKKTTGYLKPCFLGPELAEVMGTNQMARNEVVKQMWQIVRDRNLADPKNRQFMICDDQLYKIFGKKRVKTFGMMKYLSKHIYVSEPL